MVEISSFKRVDEDDLIVVDCKIDNVSAKIALDTGASHTVIDFGRLIEAGYRMGDTKGIVPVATANGIIGVNLFLLKHFEVFGIVKQDFLVTSHLLDDPSLEVQGVLGLDFLENYEFCINMQQQTIKLKNV